MGPYCRFCDMRCFVLRTLPADAKSYAGQTICLATCEHGAAHDRETTAYDHTTAANPARGWSGGA